MMLDAGAETDLVNSVGRTAAQMAAFVGETGLGAAGARGVSRASATEESRRARVRACAFLVAGQHDCVTVINNFFPRARLDYYTRPQGMEREPKLPPDLAGPLHEIIMTTNLNPVKVNELSAGADGTSCPRAAKRCESLHPTPIRQIVMLVRENPALVDVGALEKCYRVMDLLCEQCVKQTDANEVLAMKMHYISCVLQKCLSFLQKRDDKLDTLVKR